MLESVGNIFKIPDLKRKIFFTALILVIYRLGGFVPTPGVNAKVVSSFFNSAGAAGNLFGLANLFSGGNLGRLSIFALGIMPYITTSIVIQLLGSIIPFFERLKKEGAEGQKKINQYTRYGTVAVAAFQAIGISFWTQSITAPLTVNGVQKVVSAVTHPGLLFVFTSVITFSHAPAQCRGPGWRRPGQSRADRAGNGARDHHRSWEQLPLHPSPPVNPDPLPRPDRSHPASN